MLVFVFRLLAFNYCLLAGAYWLGSIILHLIIIETWQIAIFKAHHKHLYTFYLTVRISF